MRLAELPAGTNRSTIISRSQKRGFGHLGSCDQVQGRPGVGVCPRNRVPIVECPIAQDVNSAITRTGRCRVVVIMGVIRRCSSVRASARRWCFGKVNCQAVASGASQLNSVEEAAWNLRCQLGERRSPTARQTVDCHYRLLTRSNRRLAVSPSVRAAWLFRAKRGQEQLGGLGSKVRRAKT